MIERLNLFVFIIFAVDWTFPSGRDDSGCLFVLGWSWTNQIPLKLNQLNCGNLVVLLPFCVVYIWYEWMVEGLWFINRLFILIVLLLDNTLQIVYLHICCLSTWLCWWLDRKSCFKSLYFLGNIYVCSISLGSCCCKWWVKKLLTLHVSHLLLLGIKFRRIFSRLKISAALNTILVFLRTWMHILRLKAWCFFGRFAALLCQLCCFQMLL